MVLQHKKITFVLRMENQTDIIGMVARVLQQYACLSLLWSQWVVGLILGSGATYELSCLLVLSLATRVFLWVLWFSSVKINF
jgi:hypothetical protein